MKSGKSGKSGSWAKHGSGGLAASDDFNRTDTNTLGTSSGGHSWVQHGSSGATQIKTNQLRTVVSTTVKGYAYIDAETANNQFSQGAYILGDALSGWAVRIDPAGDETNATMYMAMVDDTGPGQALSIYKFVGVSIETALGTQIATKAKGWTGGEVVRIEANGTTIRVLVDDVEELSVTDSDIASGRVGVASPLKASGFTDQGDWDDFTGGDL